MIPGHCGLINVSGDNKTINKSSLQKAVDLFVNSKISVSKNEFMKIFGIKDDPCHRSDIMIRGKDISNEGESCIVNEYVENKKGILVSMPQEFHAKRTENKNKVILTMDDPEKTIGLKFTNKNPSKVDLMNQEYAGKVTRMDLENNNAVIWTTAGCIKFSF